MCYNNCYYYPCIHTPGAYSYGYGPMWSMAEYTMYSPSSTASTYSSVSSASGHATAGASSYHRYALVAEEEERLRTLRRSRRSRNTSSDDDVYNVSVRYRGGGHRSSSLSPSPTIPASMLPPTYYAFVPASSRRRVRVSLYD